MTELDFNLIMWGIFITSNCTKRNIFLNLLLLFPLAEIVVLVVIGCAIRISVDFVQHRPHFSGIMSSSSLSRAGKKGKLVLLLPFELKY